ncbi:MAG: antiviral reverse transcriptase Drt3b, partial [Brevinema sp.]
MKNKKRIKSDISRVFTSEILPYEVPLIFNNDNIKYDIDTKFKGKPTIPYQYRTYQNRKDRTLSIPHPNVQQQIVKFYDEYFSLILYYTNISKFSIRKPIKKASLYYFDDIIYNEKKKDNRPFHEQDKYEYDRYHSFFVYRKYQFIHQFYKSKDFLNNEKKFPRLIKFDISRCFDTIYSHTISWAIYGQNYAKKNKGKNNVNFASLFDDLMQNCNYRETNGIIIGSEFSRLFAEVILQRIDKNIEDKLYREYDLIFKKDYILYRYVDDFFLFCRQDDQEKIMCIIKDELAFYKLYINDKKTIEYNRPFVSEQTRLKNQIQELLSKEFKVNTIEKNENSKEKYKFNTRAIPIITSLKVIVANSEDKYDGISNYILKICEKWITEIFNTVSSKSEYCDAKDVVESILNTLDIMFFVVSDIKYSSGNYIARILSIVMGNISKQPIFFAKYYKQVIFNKIYEEILLLMSYQDKSKFYVEYWNFFIILAQLRKSFRLTETKLKELINFDNVIQDSEYKPIGKFRYDYFAIIVIQFYIKDNR